MIAERLVRKRHGFYFVLFCESDYLRAVRVGQNISEKAVYSVTEAASRAADEAGIISVERDMTGADEKNVAAAGRQRVIQPFIGCHGAVFRKKGDGAPCIPLFYRDKSVGIVKDEARNAVFPAVDGSADGKRVEKHVRRVFRAELFVCQGEFRRKIPEKNAMPVTISRCSNNYGPYHFPEKLIPLMIANALADKPLPVYGEGLNVRDWLYVEDHCKAIDLIIHKGRVGEVYNVGGHNEKQNIEIVKIICKELGKPESLITHVGDRKGHDMRYAIDPTKIHNELGWLPETKFEDGIKKTIQWYLDNREWWQTIISGEYQNYYEKMYGNR